MSGFNNSPRQNARVRALIAQPRFLRAIPSLVVLTTAMAWGVASDPDVMDATGRKAGLTHSHPADNTATGTGGDAYVRGLPPRR